MRTRFVEATQAVEGGFNHGKFLVGRFDAEEWERPTELDPARLETVLLRRVGWTPEHAVVFDLQTGEGAIFRLGGSARADLSKHRVWVCPMFEPFLEWLYACVRATEPRDGWFDALPPLVELPEAPASMQGYRRGGTR